MAKRRTFLKSTGIAATLGVTGLAGCTGGSGDSTSGSTDESSGDATTESTQTEKPETSYGNGELNFLMSPSEPQDTMMAQYAPVKEQLTSELSVPASLKYARNYSAVLQALESGTGDVAETGPFAAALGVNAGKAEIALQRKGYGSWTYTSTIVTSADSDISSLEDLEGKSVAFADRLSASGALFPLYMLKEAGLNIGDYPTGEGAEADFDGQFAGGHSAAFAAVTNGQVDAAGVGQFITLTENDDGERVKKDSIEYVETYDGIPRAPIVVSPALSDEEHTNVVSALEEAPDSMYLGEDGEADTDDDLWFSGLRAADKSTYQPVIDVAKDLGVKTEFLDG